MASRRVPSDQLVARTIRQIALTVVVAATALTTGCGASNEREEVTRSTPSPTSANRKAPAFPALGRCQGARVYTTVTDWLPKTLPAQLSITAASTGIFRQTHQLGAPTMPSGAGFSLAERGPDNRLIATIGLGTTPPGALDVSQVTGWDPASDEAPLSSVRGHAGQVVHVINRGGSGARYAIWDEAGVHWTAVSEVSVADLAAALAPLTISADTVRDPTHRFETIGTTPSDSSDDIRRTNITLHSADDVQRYRPITIEIDAAVPGSTGVSGTPPLTAGFTVTPPPPPVREATIGAVNGHAMLIGPFWKDVSTGETWGPEVHAATADGDQITINSGSKRTDVSPELIVQIAASLRRTTHRDRDLERLLPKDRASNFFCREA